MTPQSPRPHGDEGACSRCGGRGFLDDSGAPSPRNSRTCPRCQGQGVAPQEPAPQKPLPMSDEEIADCRTVWGNYLTRFTGGRIAATIDADRAELLRLRQAWARLEAPDEAVTRRAMISYFTAEGVAHMDPSQEREEVTAFAAAIRSAADAAKGGESNE